MELGGDTLCFLDLNISIINNRLETTVYRKPTDSHLYLHNKSCHNRKSINGIQKGVALRLRRICSTEAEFQIKANEYMKYLTSRGHDVNKVKEAFEAVKSMDRAEARKPVTSKRNNNRIIFSTKFNPRGPDVKSIIKRNLPIIESDPFLAELFPAESILVAFKKENTLSNLLLRSDPYNVKESLLDNTEKGYVKCTRKCDSCNNFVDATSNITSFATGRKFKIRSDITCNTRNIIYVAYCVSCGKQGVGSSVSWKPRLANYKSHIKNKIRSCKIATHFIDTCNANSLRFILVDVVNNIESLTLDEIDTLLLDKEKFWIGTLVTQHKGLNGTHDWNRSKRTDKEKM